MSLVSVLTINDHIQSSVPAAWTGRVSRSGWSWPTRTRSIPIGRWRGLRISAPTATTHLLSSVRLGELWNRI